MVQAPVRDDPQRFLVLVARFAPAMMTLLAARAILALAAAMTLLAAPLTPASAKASVVVSAVFVLGLATQLAASRWRH